MSHSNKVLGQLIGEIREQLAEAHTIATAADACAIEGQLERAMVISLDIEELIHSANHLLQANFEQEGQTGARRLPSIEARFGAEPLAQGVINMPGRICRARGRASV